MELHRAMQIINVGNVTSYTVSGLAGGPYYFVATAYDSEFNQSSYSNEVSATVQAVLAVNSGGPRYTSTYGVIYQADTDYTGGSTYSTTASISGTTDPTLYQTMRYGNLSYNIPLAGGDYLITLEFSKI